MSEPETQRQDYLDCAHGLMIMHVMIYHLCFSINNNYKALYSILHTLSFFMAWFFFKSGMFYRERTLFETALRCIKKLIVPYFIFSIVAFDVYYFVKHPIVDFSMEWRILYLFGTLIHNMPLWFLFSLFAVHISYALLHKCKLNPFIIAALSLALFFLNKAIGFRPYWMLNIPLGLLFYSLGQIFKDVQYNNIVISICLIIYFGLYFIYSYIDFSIGIINPYLVAIPWSLAGCILINVLFKSFPRLCIAPLKFFGKHAMEFFCTHIIFIDLFEHIVEHSELIISDTAFKIIAFTTYILLLTVVLYFFKPNRIQWMFGRFQNVKTNQEKRHI